MSKPDAIMRSRERFLERNVFVVNDTRARILEVRRKAIEYHESLRRERTERMVRLMRNLDATVTRVRAQHEQVKRRLSREAVSREVHLRVNRSLEALEEIIRVQRETEALEELLTKSIGDPAIAGTPVDRERKASLSSLISGVQKQLIQQTEFINVAAHELRTPIMPILVSAEIMQSETGTKSERLEVIVRNAVRLQRLADNILNVARIDSKTLRLNKTEFDLVPLLREIVSDKDAATKEIKISFQTESEEVLIRADKDRISQVVNNLLDNAIKFTKEGKVLVRLEQADGSISVSVSDNGPGIDSDILPLLFTKFAAKSSGGTGLGLYISKGIIEAHGGTMTARNGGDSDLPGATFEFTFPLSKSASLARS